MQDPSDRLACHHVMVQVRILVCCIVGLSVSESDHARNHLIKILKTGKPFAQFASIEALSRMKIKSVEFVEGLKLATDSENESLRELANKELSAIQAED